MSDASPAPTEVESLLSVLEPPTVRGMLLDMVEEYARHTGHADILREAVDGRVGEGAPKDFSF